MQPPASRSALVLVDLGLTSPKLVRAHDVNTAFKGLKVKGIKRYPERSLLLPGTAVVNAGLPPGYLDYLTSIRLGVGHTTSSIIEVPANTGLIRGLASGHADHIAGLLDMGMRLEFFLSTVAAEQKFVEKKLGRTYADVVWGPSAQVAAMVNDKAWLRQFVARHNLKVTFPEGNLHTLDQVDAALATARHLLLDYSGVALKLPNLASGDGMLFVYPAKTPDWESAFADAFQKLAAKARKAKRPDTLIIVEAAHPEHVPLSAQLEIGPEGPRFIRETLNRVVNGTVHDGNTLSSDTLTDIPEWVAEQMYEQAMTLGWALYNLEPEPYEGYIGLDFMLAGDRLMMLEGNGRPTAVMYPLGVALQAETNYGALNWAVTTGNLEPAEPLDFETLRLLLDAAGLLFDGVKGALPVCPSLLPRRKAMIYYYGSTVRQAEDGMHEVRQLLRSP